MLVTHFFLPGTLCTHLTLYIQRSALISLSVFALLFCMLSQQNDIKRVEDKILMVIRFISKVITRWHLLVNKFWSLLFSVVSCSAIRDESTSSQQKSKMTFSDSKIFLLLCFAFSTCYAKPNVVIIMADDYVCEILMEMC